MLKLREQYIQKVIRKEMRLQEAAEVLGVSRQSFSKWYWRYRQKGFEALLPKKPGRQKGSAWNRTAPEVEESIIRMAEEHCFEGPKTLALRFSQEVGKTLDPATIYRILRRRGIRYHDGDHDQKKKKPQLYVLDRPGRELQGDVSFPFGYSRKEVVYSALDDCSRFAFSQVMSDHSEESTLAFFRELVRKCPFPISTIRTDQGREFSRKVTEFLKSQGIVHLRNPPYTPEHNGKVERYHRTFKEQAVVHWSYSATLDELNYSLSLWLSYYNFQRPHTGLGMLSLTPAQKILYAAITSSFLPQKNVNLSLQQNKIC